MGSLAAKDSNEKRPFKPQIYKSRGSYSQCQNRSVIKEVIKIEVD